MTRFGPWLLFLISCTRPADQCTTSADCEDPQYPFCDVYGQYPASGGVTDVCTIAPPTDAGVTCTPGGVLACKGDQAETCNAAGTGYDLDECMLGCVAGPAPHCVHVQPMYLPDACNTPAAGSSLMFASSGQFDPNLDLNCTAVVSQPDAADICVVHYRSIEIGSGVVLTILGSMIGSGHPPGRAIAFIADKTLVIDGLVDVGAHVGENGPGGGVFASGAQPETTLLSPITEYGGGGAGGATAGGAGAINYPNGSAYTTTGSDGGAVNGGAPATNPALLSVLVGGASSPTYATDSDTDATLDGYLGGGGGAVELVSCQGTAHVSGTINAGGGGGAGGFAFNPSFAGGAGGTIIVEGANVSLTGSVFANGGAGGAGCWAGSAGQVGLFSGSNGADGSLSDTEPALGGSIPALLGSGTGSGGNGGFIGAPPHVGIHGTTGINCPGAGGGSVGFIQTYTPAGVAPTLAPAHTSPALQPNGTVQTR